MICLGFQLKVEARSIYKTYLSDSAPYSVNIDDTAKIEEKDLEQPTPDMFNKAQTQVNIVNTFTFDPMFFSSFELFYAALIRSSS